MQAFENYTPHTVTVNRTVFPSLGNARVNETHVILGQHDGIEIYKVYYSEIFGLPAPKAGVLYIVSMVVIGANLLLPNPRTDLVRPDSGSTATRINGQIVSINGFCR